jgi:NB-ARC domain
MLLTTRDFTVATSLAANYLQINVLSDEDGTEMLIKAVGLEKASSIDREHALAISKTLGGLPLALSQIGGFITQRKLRLQDFLSLYERYYAKIDARKGPGSEYEHTLSTVWSVSFEKLTENSTRLLNILSFLDPDSISEDIFLKGSQDLDDGFSFLSDEMELVTPPIFKRILHYLLTSIA